MTDADFTAMPPIVGMHSTTMVDWEGLVAAVIFFPACNFRCPYCHAVDMVLSPNNVPRMEFSEFQELVESRRAKWLDGIVITGGEPTLHDGLELLCRWIREKNLGVKLDTNGTNPEVLERLISEGLLTHIAMDVKGPLDERYSQNSGVNFDIEIIKRSIDIIMNSGVSYEFRTTVCPALLSPEDIVAMATDLKDVKDWVLQAFRPVACLDPALCEVEEVSFSMMEEVCEIARGVCKNVRIRGAH